MSRLLSESSSRSIAEWGEKNIREQRVTPDLVCVNKQNTKLTKQQIVYIIPGSHYMTSLQSADKWCTVYTNRYNSEKSLKIVIGHNKWQVSPALFVPQWPLTPEIFYSMKVKYCVASIFIIYPDLSQWHGTTRLSIRLFKAFPFNVFKRWRCCSSITVTGRSEWILTLKVKVNPVWMTACYLPVH